MPAHIHAELMALYAQDAAETDSPWELWEVRQRHREGSVVVYGDWRDCVPSDMTFPDDHEYRRKPRAININGHEVPEPVRKPLECGAEYFAPAVGGVYFATEFYWRGDEVDNRLLERGLVHLTKEAAIAHAKALLSFTAKPEAGNE